MTEVKVEIKDDTLTDEEARKKFESWAEKHKENPELNSDLLDEVLKDMDETKENGISYWVPTVVDANPDIATMIEKVANNIWDFIAKEQ